MHSGATRSSADGGVPVFVFPPTINFYADDPNSHKRILTLYNPYAYPVKFKVLSNSPQKYAVVDSGGSIKPSCCIDIVIRHTAIQPSNYDITDKFRILMYKHGQKQHCGRKDVPVTLLARKDVEEEGNEKFEQFLPSSLPHNQAQQYSIRGDSREISGTGPSLVIVLAAIICIAALMLPTEGQDQSGLPLYLQLTVPQKLIFAYTLGLVTMVILRP